MVRAVLGKCSALKLPLLGSSSSFGSAWEAERSTWIPDRKVSAVYADRADADADYDTLLDLHSADLVGSYDVALVYKDDEGKVHVTKHEKPTQHGAWTGAAVGALVGIIFPPSILGAALVGAAAGGGIGHVMGGMSRGDAKELGEHLDEGQAALVVIGKSRVQEQLDKALTRAQKSEEREIDADGKELAKELNALPS
jgi:uncharacterized membrane protein